MLFKQKILQLKINAKKIQKTHKTQMKTAKKIGRIS